MLEQMTARQYRELLMFIHAKAESKERMEAEAQEARIMHHMARIHAKQQAEHG